MPHRITPQAVRLRRFTMGAKVHEYTDTIKQNFKKSIRTIRVYYGNLPNLGGYMTSFERDQLFELRGAGYSYRQIALRLCLSENTVKSFFRRSASCAAPEHTGRCKQCGRTLPTYQHGRKRRFCSDVCRYAWCYSHRVLNEKNSVSKRCACCGKVFFSYASSDRKYCSRDCYVSDRFGKEARYASRTD